MYLYFFHEYWNIWATSRYYSAVRCLYHTLRHVNPDCAKLYCQCIAPSFYVYTETSSFTHSQIAMASFKLAEKNTSLEPSLKLWFSVSVLRRCRRQAIRTLRKGCPSVPLLRGVESAECLFGPACAAGTRAPLQTRTCSPARCVSTESLTTCAGNLMFCKSHLQALNLCAKRRNQHVSKRLL